MTSRTINKVAVCLEVEEAALRVVDGGSQNGVSQGRAVVVGLHEEEVCHFFVHLGAIVAIERLKDPC